MNLMNSLARTYTHKIIDNCLKAYFSENNKVRFSFVYIKDNTEVPVEAKIGQNILEVARMYNIDLEGACDGNCACSTCHVIFENKIFEKLPKATEEEEDMLDLAFGLSSTSRLGCQVKVVKEFHGMKLKIPAETRNLYVDKQKTTEKKIVNKH